MSKLRQLLKNEYGNEYDLRVLKQFSTPKIYTGNNNIEVRWYVYFSFRNPATGKLVRQTPIYDNLHKIKDLRERKIAIKKVCIAIHLILKNGYNPYSNFEPVDEIQVFNIPDAVNFVIKLKESSLKDSSYKDFKVRINQFKRWLLNNGFEGRLITSVNKKAAINYLNEVASKTSAKNRNNSRAVLSMFFQALEDNEITTHNFIKNINVLKSTPERNKTYSSKQEIDIFNYLLENDKLLLLFIQFISYNHLRPVEVVRLKIGDVNIIDKILNVRAKNKAVKIKLIPEVLLSKIPDLTNFDSNAYLFTPKGIGMNWETNETDKRDYFSKRFKVVKTKLNLGKDYGLYSFRHTFITKLYNSLLVNSTPFEAKSRLMLITGHTTMTALEKYLRDIDAVLPEDYSKFILE